MMEYILVHGAWQGAWCWEPLATVLRNLGHTVSCPDLPGHGLDSTPLSQVTYDLYYKSLEKELHRHKKPQVLVAHSMSGILAAPLLDQYPERISHLVLIAAFVAQNGESLFDLALSGGPSEIPDVVITDEKNLIQSLDLKKVKHTLYRDCPSTLADWAIQKLKPQPMRPFLEPVNWVDSGKTEYKRTYILCEDDRDVHPITQLNVLKQYPCRIIKLKSGHFPFLSHINELGQILNMIKE